MWNAVGSVYDSCSVVAKKKQQINKCKYATVYFYNIYVFTK